MKLPGARKWGLNSNEESYAHNDNGVGSFESSMFMSSKEGVRNPEVHCQPNPKLIEGCLVH